MHKLNTPPPPTTSALYVSRSILGMTTFVVIFFGSNLIKHLGWRAGALTTPLSMAALAAPLFGVVVASKVRFTHVERSLSTHVGQII